MAKVTLRKTNRARRKLRVRKKVFGTKEMPRLTVFRSNKYAYAQLIDDTAGKTVASVSLNDLKKMHEKTKKTDASFELGKLLAQKAAEKKVKKAVFDRNGYKYHGRVQKVADGAREGGLKL